MRIFPRFEERKGERKYEVLIAGGNLMVHIQNHQSQSKFETKSTQIENSRRRIQR